ncbi:hypothetical protein V1477_003407 [Vespula maculifrons]|uniref:Uncharacterized protein n=1 Tax=Vespula maculifrons TaxID=7453 RepID=A0ABD2CUE8_VESMC
MNLLAIFMLNFVELLRVKSGTGNESNNGDSDIILGVRNRKIRIMNSESESVAMMSHKILIKFSKESGEISSRVRFMLSEKSACPQVSSNVKEYL